MNKLEIVWSSAMNEYEELTLEILLDRYPVVRVNQENGVDNLIAELGGPKEDGWMICQVALDDLIKGLVEIRELMRARPATPAVEDER
jgi:hypothetical protein